MAEAVRSLRSVQAKGVFMLQSMAFMDVASGMVPFRGGMAAEPA